MLVGVIVVQQIEGHILQPFLMGRFVSLHPLGVIIAIGCGVLVAGIAGALIAVPLAAAGNAVAQHLATYTDLGDEDPTLRSRRTSTARAHLASRCPTTTVRSPGPDAPDDEEDEPMTDQVSLADVVAARELLPASR